MKVWLQQIAFVDYRERIFGLIADAIGNGKVRYLGGLSLREKGLNVIDSIQTEEGPSAVSVVKNRFLSGGMCWQSGIVIPVMFGNYEAIVLQGDAKILSNWVVQVIALVRQKRVLLWTHGYYGHEAKLKSLIRLMSLRLSSGLLLYGNYARQLLEQQRFDTEKLYVVYNSSGADVPNHPPAVDGRELERLTCEFFPEPVQVLISFVGRLTDVKRLDILIEALDQLRDSAYSVGLLIIGDGELRADLGRLVEELGLEGQVYFYGACYDRERVSELMALTDICVSPGNVGLTAMTAMEAGTPVITHDNASNQMPEYEVIKEGETGDFFQEGDAGDLARVIAKWIDSSKDRDAIRQSCVEMIRKYYNPEVQVEIIKGAISGEPASRFPRRSV